MGKPKVDVQFILDETGSMGNVWEVTMSSFNEYIATLQQDDNAKYTMSLVQFSSLKNELVYDAVPIAEVAPRTEKNYRPGGMTPLYDAIYKGIQATKKRNKGKKGKVLFVILTDGNENDSREHNLQEVSDLIKKLKKKWQFVFLGVDIDAYAAGGMLGISRDATVSLTSAETEETYKGLTRATVAYAAAPDIVVSNFAENMQTTDDAEEEGSTTCKT